MSRFLIDLTGKTFDKLYVIKRAEKPNGIKDSSSYWLCKCDCGKIKAISSKSLRNKDTKSCGCIRKKPYKIKNNDTTIKHLYRIWCYMKNRCYNKNLKYYIDWGGRGIKVCDEWLGENGFENFYNWAINNGWKYEKQPNGKNKWTLDRINNDKDYSPENCRFVTMKEQCNNRRSSHYVTYNGETLTMIQWAEKLNIPVYLIRNRLKYNWDMERVFDISNMKKRRKI